MAEPPPILHKLRERSWQEGKNARCPVLGHGKGLGDNSASLGVTVEGDRVLLHCFAGCSLDDVLAALGCSKRDLYSPNGSARSARPTETRFEVRDGGGNLLGIKVRLDFPDDRPKKLWWCGPDGKKPKRKIEAREMPLFGADLLRERPDDPVILVEGELKALDLRGGGVLALGTVTGSGCVPADEVLSDLRGRKVILWPDADESGRKHMRAIGSALRRLGAASVWWVTWPDARPGDDAADFLAARRREGKTGVQIEEGVHELLATAGEFSDVGNGDADEGATAPSSRTGGPIPAALLPYRPFPVDLLPETFRRFVDTSAASIGVDPAYVALPLLGAAAGAIGASRSIRLKATWTEPCVLWFGIVGDSGSGKTPGHDRALEPLRELQTEFLAEHDRERREFERQQAAAKTNGPKPSDAERPKARRILVSDTTVEALAVLVRDNPHGLTLDRDELSGWVGSFDAYKSGKGADVSFWLSLYRAQPITVDRKGSPDPIHAPRPHVSIVGTVQPGVLRRVLGRENRENGLASRLLLAMPPRPQRTWTDAAPDGAAEDVRVAFEKLVALKDDDGRPLALPLDESAHGVWVEFFNEHGAVQASLFGDLAALAAKIEGAAARLALVVHVVRAASGERIDSTCIDVESVEAGIALARWFFEEGCRIYGVLEEDAAQRQRRQDVEFIRRKGGSVTAREFNRGRRNVPDSDAARVRLNEIERAGLGRWVDCPAGESGGRPTKRLVLLDPVDETTKPKPPAETTDGGVDETTKPDGSEVSGSVDPSTGGESDDEPEPGA